LNVWLVAATVLLAALALPLSVLVRAPHFDALVGLELASTVMVVVLLLLSEGFHRSIYTALPMTLAPLSLVGGLVLVQLVRRS
jgi:multisubunit Na+/H+ antiporter MnhF subunit